MSENLYNTAHKTPTKKYRDNYERIFKDKNEPVVKIKKQDVFYKQIGDDNGV